MIVRSSVTKQSFILSAASLTVAAISILLGQQVNYLNYLILFNSMAVLMLSLAIASLLLSIIGIWRQQGRSLWSWAAAGLALCVLLCVFD
ncbi:hypothetical protein [cf. Phormidesmis sp. LEGE 11477]|uniref:hypothetical protein n=1 Tax=cf. Phormidesmis sp. LEGE 11477 TaxID=1828680 RepID=UPI00187EA76C|nr:hypothetical protein [cf. Phormidesmis sp. LEGE 11477]MBE9063936.1 hypothetical protein [cf. Phormidesmis sp. LEGE 11477]